MTRSPQLFIREHNSQHLNGDCPPACPGGPSTLGNLRVQLPLVAMAHDRKLRVAPLEIGPNIGAAATATLTDEA